MNDLKLEIKKILEKNLDVAWSEFPNAIRYIEGIDICVDEIVDLVRKLKT